MEVTGLNWKNKNGTSDRNCECGSWKKHWIKHSNASWPLICSVSGCNNLATLGAHVINSDVDGERIIPACDSCNQKAGNFHLKGNVILVRAVKATTCAQ